MKTLREKYIAGLTARGFKEVKRTSKWVVFEHHILPSGDFYYVGKSGSLRTGTTIATSIPVSQRYKDQLIAIAAGIM